MTKSPLPSLLPSASWIPHWPRHIGRLPPWLSPLKKPPGQLLCSPSGRGWDPLHPLRCWQTSLYSRDSSMAKPCHHQPVYIIPAEQEEQVRTGGILPLNSELAQLRKPRPFPFPPRCDLKWFLPRVLLCDFLTHETETYPNMSHFPLTLGAT